MRFLGVDPDTFTTALVVVERLTHTARPPAEPQYRILDARTVRVNNKVKVNARLVEMSLAVAREMGQIDHMLEIDGVAVEGQRHRPRTKVRPQDLIHLATISGAVMASVEPWVSHVLLPEPSTWKGSVPKRIHQPRILTRLGIESKVRASGDAAYVTPSEDWLRAHPHLPQNFGEWKHLVDAAGLAIWGIEHTIKVQRRRARR